MAKQSVLGMKEKEMKPYFLPYKYQDIMSKKMWELKQGSLTVHD